jgi:hypothetical protein
MLRRGLWIALALAGTACYGSTAADDDAEQDVTPGDHAGDAADADADADTDADADADADADVGPDGTIACAPEVDGSWLSFTVDTGGPAGDTDLETPCRLGIIVGGPPGHDGVRLECGTGAAIRTFTFDFFANPRVYLNLWDGQDVMLHYVENAPWWTDRWFTVRSPSGTLLFAGTDASAIAPPGVDPHLWYEPLGVRVLGGLCPAVDEMCGPRERQGVEVTYGTAQGVVFDGYQAYVGEMVTADVHVGAAWNYLSMECDDAPNNWYTLLIVLPPEG